MPTDKLQILTPIVTSVNGQVGDVTIATKTSELTNDSNFATTTYVDTKVAGIVDSAPETLDTLNELSAALGNDPNFATTVANQIGAKVDKVNGKGLSTNDLTSALKSNYDTAYTHSQQAHSPANAEKNIIISIKKNGTAINPDSSRSVNITVPTKVSDLTNDSSFATTSYVDTAVAGLVGSAPETLDTLNELSAALGDDPNFATTVANQIGAKVDKVNGKGLSTNDYTTTEKNKLSGIETGAQKNTLTGIKGNAESIYRTGNVNITPSDIGAAVNPRVLNITLPKASWTGGNPYTQTVTISGGNSSTKCDISFDETVFTQMCNDSVDYLVIENDGGIFTAKAKGGKPSVDMVIQVTCTIVTKG